MTFSLATYTFVHVLLSLIGIGSGFIMLTGLFTGRRLDRWTLVFLASTVATSLNGFGFPAHRFLPSHAVGILSLVVLAVAILARYTFHLAGVWRPLYVVGAAVALYLNVFVGIVQAFEKVPALKTIAPTQSELPSQSELPFVVTQLVVSTLFIVLTIVAAVRFRLARS